MISLIVARTFDLILIFMVIMALLSWFPNIPWYKQPFKTLRAFTDIIVGPFRKVIPPLGMLDISFMVAAFTIYLIGWLLTNILRNLGL
jgi:YggT family protein